MLDSEPLYRVVLSPGHFTKKGELKPSVFPCSHIKEGGLSVVRSNRVNEGKLAVFCNALAAMQPGRKWRGGVEFPSLVVRNLHDDGGRQVCLIDDPTPEENGVPANDAHALVVAAHNAVTDEDAKEIRAAFLESGVLKLVGG